MSSATIERAIISVSDKTGLAEFARGLAAKGIEIYSTGGTRRFLEDAGVAVCDVAEYTGFPEMMEGRVKTLHPKVHGGILCRRDNPEDMKSAAEHGIRTFDLIVVNLYPFAATVAKPDVTEPEAIEQIDIGGPSMVRAAAKNFAFVSICTSPAQYQEILEQVAAHGCTTFGLRRKLAGEAFAHTATYDHAVAAYFAGVRSQGGFPATLDIALERKATLRYGENPHQSAALYAQRDIPPGSLVSAEQLNGKELSYNNLLDLDSAVEIARGFAGPAVAVIKHNNPCGAAEADTLAEALRRALAGDPLSAFGSVLGLNREMDQAAAEVLCEPGLFIEAIAAPSFQPAALEMLTTRPKWKTNVRLMRLGELSASGGRWDYRHIHGGVLMQQADALADPEQEWKTVTEKAPSEAEMADIRFAWRLVRYVKSNAIAVCRGRMLLGAGAGQMSRVDSVEIALKKAGQRAAGAVLSSDAFFPFPDSIELAAAAGITAIVQPGGSVKDQEVIAACNRLGVSMLFTGRRHFRH